VPAAAVAVDHLMVCDWLSGVHMCPATTRALVACSIGSHPFFPLKCVLQVVKMLWVRCGASVQPAT